MRKRLAIVCLTMGALAFSLASVPSAAPPSATHAAPAGQGRGGGSGVTTSTIFPPREQPQTGAGAISGVVTDGESRRPVAGALVQLRGDAGSALRPRQMTDAQGRFIFTDLPACPDFTLSIAHPAYLPGAFEAVAGVPETVQIALSQGQWFSDANVSLHKPASISGMVISINTTSAVLFTKKPRHDWAFIACPAHSISFSSAITIFSSLA
jgi:hypothetical protein